MGNREWELGTGDWRLEIRDWRMENGEWRRRLGRRFFIGNWVECFSCDCYL